MQRDCHGQRHGGWKTRRRIQGRGVTDISQGAEGRSTKGEPTDNTDSGFGSPVGKSGEHLWSICYVQGMLKAHSIYRLL